jgi:hypothetical protein
MTIKTNLVGMFLVLDTTDHEYYRTGEIVAAVGNCYLIQFDQLEADQPLPPMELFTLVELMGGVRIASRSSPTCSRPAPTWKAGSLG